MECIILKFSQNDTIIFQNVPIIVILLATYTLKFANFMFIFIDTIVSDIPVSKEILDLEGIKFLFVLDNLYWGSFSLFSEESYWCTFLKDADLWEEISDFTG